MRTAGILTVILVAVAATIALNSYYIVREYEQVVKLRFGEVVFVANPAGEVSDGVAIGEGPGLYLKVPLIENTVRYDSRNIMLDSNPSLVTVAGGERITVDSFARYKITDPVTFYSALNNLFEANSKLSALVEDSVRAVLGGQSQETIISEERARLMVQIRDRVNAQAKANQFGVEVIDVRIRRADLPEANADNVYARMETERRQQAALARAQGNERARIISAETDRQVVGLIAQARKESETIKGEGDAQRNRIFAEAYNLNPEFADFYRSLQAYKAAASEGDQLIISPDSEFYRYFTSERGGR